MAIELRAYNPVEVKLGEFPFESVDLPQKSSARFAEVAEELAELSDDDEDRAVELLLEGFDLLLKPTGEGKQKPSEVLRSGLESESITPRQFISLWSDLLAGIEEANGEGGSLDRPT